MHGVKNNFSEGECSAFPLKYATVSEDKNVYCCFWLLSLMILFLAEYGTLIIGKIFDVNK